MKIWNNIRIALVAILCGITAACDDEDIPGASYESGVWFYNTGKVISQGEFDMEAFNKLFSGSYSFYFFPDVEEYTFELPEVRLMGRPVDYDREVNLIVGEGSTAEEGRHFKIVDNVLPANAVSFVPKVVLFRKELGDEEKIVKFVLAPSEEFPAQIFGDTISDDQTFLISSHYELRFSRLISEPPYWSECKVFGKWSKVKHDFMYEILGIYWGVEPVTPADRNKMFDDVLRMRNALQKYNKDHPDDPMKDEDGNRVEFY